MNRRTFLHTGSVLAAATVFNASANGTSLFEEVKPGIQLYMVRNEMMKNPADTLKQLGAMGYKQLESYGGDKGIFWGMESSEFQKLAGSYGITIVSAHHNPMTPAEFEQLAARAAAIGIKYLVCPWLGPQKSIDSFKQFANDFNTRGQVCKKHGLRYAYHPHDYPYKPVNGQLPINVLINNTDKDLVDFQLDVYYTVTEGQDPFKYLNTGRFKLMHLRDVLKQRLPKGSEEESACDLGEGIINFPKLITAARHSGANYFFIEQSRFYHETPLQSAKKNAAYLKAMRQI